MKKITQKIINILKTPQGFFRSLNEKGVKKAFLYSIILLLFSTILSVLVNYSSYKSLYFLTNNIFFFVIIPILWIMGVGLMFVYAVFLHIWILIFGGKKDYSKAYQLMIYSFTPIWLLGWIPYLGLFTGIYSLFLLIVGTREIYKIPKTKAILMYVIPATILILLIALLLILPRFLLA